MMNYPIAEAMDHLDPKLIGRYFEMRANFERRAGGFNRRRNIKIVTSLAACFCVACICVFAVIMNNNNTPPVVDNGGNGNTNSVVPGLDLPSEDEIFWPDSSGGQDSSNEDGNDYVIWNGKKVDDRLYDTLMKADDDSLLYVYVLASNRSELLDKHVYKGETYVQHQNNRRENEFLLRKIYDLLEVDGEYLKHGEKICTEGNEYGEKWHRYYYNQRVEFYGEDFLSTYIVDGVLLREKLEADREKVENQVIILEATVDDCINDFGSSYANENIHRFDNIDGYAFIYGSIELILTKEAFKNMTVEGMEDFTFYAVERPTDTKDGVCND